MHPQHCLVVWKENYGNSFTSLRSESPPPPPWTHDVNWTYIRLFLKMLHAFNLRPVSRGLLALLEKRVFFQIVGKTRKKRSSDVFNVNFLTHFYPVWKKLCFSMLLFLFPISCNQIPVHNKQLRLKFFCSSSDFEQELAPNVFVSQQIFTCSKSTIETQEKGVNFGHISYLFLLFLSFTLMTVDSWLSSNIALLISHHK